MELALGLSVVKPGSRGMTLKLAALALPST
jgi:hypothetical protein